MTQPMFKASNRWNLPDLGKLIHYGSSAINQTLSTADFAQIHNLGPDKASSYLEHLRACCICERDNHTKKYTATEFFMKSIENRLGEIDLASLIYFNYVHYMEPTKWMVLNLFDEAYHNGIGNILKELIFERYVAEKLKNTDDPRKHSKRVRDAINSLIGLNGQLSAFHSLCLYREEESSIKLFSFVPRVSMFALAFIWAWKRNFEKQIISLERSQVIKSIEFPFRIYRLSYSESNIMFDALANLNVIRLVKSADLDQVYFDHSFPENQLYLL